MKSEIIFIIVVIVLAAFMYISLFGLIIDTFETRRYKIEYKSTVGAIKSNGLTPVSAKHLFGAIKSILQTYFRTRNYDECISEIDILFRNRIMKNERLNKKFSNVVVLLECHILDINSGKIKVECENIDDYKIAISKFLAEYQLRNPLEQIKGTDFLILKQLIDCLESQKVDEGKNVVNRIAVELKTLKDSNMENEKNSKKQDAMTKVGLVLSVVFGLMTFIQFFI